MDAYHRNSCTKCAYAESTDKTANGKLLPRMCGSNLNDHTNHKDQTFQTHSITPTHKVRCTVLKTLRITVSRTIDTDLRGSGECAYEGPNRQQTDNETRTDGREFAS